MNTNHVICKNRVEVEGVDIGQFESFKAQATSRTLGATAVMMLPLYALGTGDTSGRASARIRKQLESPNGLQNIVKVCAKVEVFVWYESWDKDSNAFVPFEEIRAFSGFIEHIADGFPAKIFLQDNSFILRFGAVENGWNGDATIQQVVEDCIPIANKGFKEERDKLNFTNVIPDLSYSLADQNVQAESSEVDFNNWGGRSPFETIQRLMQTFVLYGGVSTDYNVYVGAGVTESDRPIVNLDTRYNVISRDIVSVDGRFVDYDVKIVGILKNGRQYTATGGFKTSKSQSEKGEYEKVYGETVRGFCTSNNVEDIQAYADRQLNMLKQNRNKGTLTLLLYPKLEILDWFTYNDTVFEEVSGGYYVLGYAFTANERGYFQKVSVTDQIYAL